MRQLWRTLPEEAAEEARAAWIAKRRAARDRLANAKQAYGRYTIYVIYAIDGIYNIYGI
jgi:ABC-type Fe3+-hydroxamate transport system substrate-binding protein